MKKAGIYDRWLHTLGGGERHTLAIAAALAKKGYSVELLTHRPTDTELLKKKFGLEKLSFSIRYLPELWDYELTPFTKEYDLFVLSSFADMIPSKAKQSLLSVFFPTTLKLTPKEWLTRSVVVPFVRFLFTFPLYIQKDATQITIGCNKPKQKATFKLVFPKLAISVVEQLEVTSLHTVVKTKVKVLHHSNTVELTATSEKPIRQWLITLPASQYTEGVAIQLKTSLWNQVGQRCMDIVPGWKERFQAGPRNFSKKEVASYTHLASISKYTKKWVAQYWGINTPIAYPPVPITDFYSSERKQKWIVSTGRFFVGGHSKKQLEMVEAFRQLHTELPGWELHLMAASTTPPSTVPTSKK